MINVIAHRGANKVAPQNTIPAFRKAIELGANGFENDVHFTKDGRIVVCHNYEIDETSNGKGSIGDYTFDELRKFDFGSYFSEDFAGTQIPSLEEFLDLCGGLDVINIEIKSPRVILGDISQATIDMVKSFGLFDKLIISSFDEDILIRCKQVDPAVKTGLLYSTGSTHIEEIAEDYVGYAKSIGADALHPLAVFVDDEYIEKCHEAGLIVNPWTVNKDYFIESLCDWGCDGVITDIPDLARDIANEKFGE